MVNASVKNLCLFHVLDGLSEGLSLFSGQSRAAVIYAETSDDPVRVYDPQNLLEGHEPRLKELYLDSDEWRENAPNTVGMKLFGEIYPEKNLQLAGLISYGGRTGSIFYQMWFTEHHPDTCSVGPTERWLEQAACLLSHGFARSESAYTINAAHILRGYSTHAVYDYIRDELDRILGWDKKIWIYPILAAVLAISKTSEEGAWPRGKLVFIDEEDLPELEILMGFPIHERPKIDNFKHVSKLLLTVDASDLWLASDGTHVLGIVTDELPRFRITADFRGGYGFLRLSGNPVCSFSDGSLRSSNRTANLVNLEEVLIDARLDPVLRHDLYRIITGIVNEAGEQRHGCTLVIDFNDPLVEISGQRLDKPVNLCENQFLELAKSVARVDGALHISADSRLHGFACLLDGRTVPGEDRARGARFNSALRFTAEHDDIIVVVVSSDRPVSVIQGGVELTAQCDLKPFSKLITPPPTMEEWIAG
ncbi:DNA integrity scanning protein DisA nucleotide-binding domain protein [Thermodesulfobacteriota bacterium]